MFNYQKIAEGDLTCDTDNPHNYFHLLNCQYLLRNVNNKLFVYDEKNKKYEVYVNFTKRI